jgi:hypothetical protein
MKYLKNELKFDNIEEVLFFDLESVSIESKLTQESPYYDSWAYKNRHEKIESETDLETLYFEKSPLYYCFARVATISMGYVSGDKLKVKEYKNTNEKELLIEFFKDVEVMFARGKRFLSGYHVFGFDMPFIAFRAMVNQIPIIPQFDLAGLKPWNIKHVIELKDIFNSTSFQTPSLMNICVALGLPSPKIELSGDGVNKVYWSDDENRINKIATYCTQDVLAVANCFCKYLMLPLVSLAESKPQEQPRELTPVEKVVYTKDVKAAEEIKEKVKKSKTKDKKAEEKVLKFLDETL